MVTSSHTTIWHLWTTVPKNYVFVFTEVTKKNLGRYEEYKKEKATDNVYLPLVRTFGKFKIT